MPRIPVHTVHSAPEPSRDGLKRLEAKFGKVLNIHGEMAHSPAVLHAYLAIQHVIADLGTFDAATREAIALAVANVDECSYCQAAHTASGRAAGLSAEQMIAVRADRADFDPKLSALLKLTREYAGNLGAVEDTTWRAALDAGWADAQLAELPVYVTLNLLTNYFNHYVGTELDLPPAPPV